MFVHIGPYPDIKKDGPILDQEITIRIDPWDVWNADITLARIIAPLLRKFFDEKDNVSCCPESFVTSNDDADTERACEQWKVILKKMIWSFQEIVDSEEHDIPLWGGTKEHQESIQEGLDLFAKHFQDLWA